jgi:5-methylcytosine-specific restriction enzyme subunit McrC
VKIPIANVYYLLCYAWGHAEERDVVSVGDVGRFERFHDLFGKVLAEGTFRLLHRGLDRGYEEIQEDLAGVRGKLDVGNMAKRALRAKGRAACIYEDLSHDVLHNRILRSTLGELLRVPDLDREVRAQVRLAFRRMGGVSVIRVTRQAFRQVQLDRNRRVYRFLLGVCGLIHEQLLVDQAGGTVLFRDFRDDDKRLWKLFEGFVTEFYRKEQTAYRVAGQRKIPWHDASALVEDDLARLPLMWADVVLESDARRIILDAKFYESALDGPFGARKLRSTNLYQLLAYLRNRQAAAPEGPRHEGILLYPVVEEPLAVEVRLEGFRIRARGVDLAQDWRRIHQDMLDVVVH